MSDNDEPLADVEVLDGCHVAAWTEPRFGMPPLTRVLSAGRTHLWPDDPDDVGDWLAHNGFRFRFQEGSAERETIVVVLEGPTGQKL